MDKKEFLGKYSIKEEEFEKTGLNWDELEKIKDDYEKKKEEFELEDAAVYIAKIVSKFNKVHSVKWRVKDSEHLIEKIIRKEKKNFVEEALFSGQIFYSQKSKSITIKMLALIEHILGIYFCTFFECNQFNINIDNYMKQITDLIGVKVIHLYKEDWEEIHNSIINKWNPKETPTANLREGDSIELRKAFENKGLRIKNHLYGYRSNHYLIETAPCKEKLIVEIQVRTIFEEGWSEIDHKVRYPYVQNDILENYLLIFNRLAGSADEMGSYLHKLTNCLNKMCEDNNKRIEEHEREIKSLKDIIESFRDKIEKLEIKIEEKEELIKSLRSLENTVNSSNSFRGINRYGFSSQSNVLDPPNISLELLNLSNNTSPSFGSDKVIGYIPPSLLLNLNPSSNVAEVSSFPPLITREHQFLKQPEGNKFCIKPPEEK